MQKCISGISSAPVRYINRLRNLDRKQWTLSDTQNYPAFLIALTLAYVAVIGLSVYMLVYFILNDEHQCYQNIRFGIIALAAIYPVQSTVIFICTIGSAALSELNCWKYFIITFLGLIVAGFSFGGLGFVYLCIINAENPILIQVSFLSSNTFIQIVAYTYISFITLYLILIPIITCKYDPQKQPVPQDQKGCCHCFCNVIYVIFQIIFMIIAIFILLLKIVGIPLLIYVLVEITRSQLANSYTSQTWFYALTIIAICIPPFVFIIVHIINKCLCSADKSQQTINSQNLKSKQQAQLDYSGKQIVFLGTEPSKGFHDDNYQLDNTKL